MEITETKETVQVVSFLDIFIDFDIHGHLSTIESFYFTTT